MKTDEEKIRELVESSVKSAFQSLKEEAETKAAEAAKKEVAEAIEEVKEAKIGPALRKDELDEAQRDANEKKWGSLGEYLEKIWLYRGGFQMHPDNRLIFVDKTGKPAIPKALTPEEERKAVLKTMTEGTDSAGGYELNAL